MKKNMETNFVIFNAPEPKTNLKEEARIDMEFVGGLYNEVCNLNLDIKDMITKVIRLGKKQTDGDTGDTEQKLRPLKVVINHTQLKYYYDQGDYNGMKAKLNHTDWGDILGTSTINHQWLGFKEYIKAIEDEFIPHRLVSNINRHKGKVPLNKESVKKKHTLWKRYMETKEGKYYAEYCRARNQVRKLTRRIQKEFEMKLATEAMESWTKALDRESIDVVLSRLHESI